MMRAKAAVRRAVSGNRRIAVWLSFVALAGAVSAAAHAVRSAPATAPDSGVSRSAAPGPQPAAPPLPGHVPAESTSAVTGTAAVEPRAFSHAVHEAVSCTVCHGTGAQHRTLLVGRQQCAACHHDGARACSACHSPSALPEPGSIAVAVQLSVVDTMRTRTLPFGHALHAAVACRDCHDVPVSLALGRSCGSCHASHHRAEAACAACHEPPLQPVHGAGVHLSCAGAGCHDRGVAPAPALSRNLCLACHPAQQQHEPEAACATCHLLRAGALSP